MDIQFGLFEHLLKSPSKDFLHQILVDAFNQREESSINEAIVKSYSEPLEIDNRTAEQLMQELAKLIKKLLFDSLTELAQIQAVFAPSSLPENLKTLLSKLLVDKLAFFKQKLLNEDAILPKLVDFDWRVDIKMNSNLNMSDESGRTGQQTCILQLKPESESTSSNETSVSRLIRSASRSNSSKPILDIAEIIMQQLRRRSQKQLGLLSFLARQYPNDKCGSNGLPLTPNSIRIYGKFQSLKTLVSPYLCRYIDIQRGSNERLFVISEHYSLNLDLLLNDTYIYNLIILSGLLTKWIHQLLLGFLMLSERQITNRFVHLKYVCVTPDGNVKLSNYGLFHMTEYGYCVNFSVINWATLAPECYALEVAYDSKHSLEQAANEEQANVELNWPKSDVWALGVILFQFLFGLASHTESSQQYLSQLLAPRRIVSLAIELVSQANKSDGYAHMMRLYEIDEKRRSQVESKTKPVIIELIKRCLCVDPAKRPDFRELLEFFEKECSASNEINDKCDENYWDAVKWNLFNNRVRSIYLTDLIDDTIPKERSNETEVDHLWLRGPNEVYYLWKLAAGDCLLTLRQNGRLSTKLTPIHKLNIYTTVRDGFEHGKQVNDEILFDDTIVPLSLSQLRAKLSSVKLDAYYPIFEIDSNRSESLSAKVQTSQLESNNSQQKFNFHLPDIEGMQKQPLNIRESDLVYQFHRLVVFARLLASYPFKKEELYRECRIDIPPLYRSLAWCALLSVPFNIADNYYKINKEVITSTDRQIDVDIPRCHQYDYLMASPQAHIKLKRILKAWVLSNPHLVYWQGLDSLCAPFLHLNFNDESRAFACLTAFVNKYATRFFLKDNAAVIHEYLAKFAHLIAFHDPELAVHFDSIEFKPDLYAIPWFLTMFAHIFPLAKIFHLWDTLLLGSSSFPLCIGVAILEQLRSILLGSDFNECILLFSELPEINIAKCVTDSINLFCNTPSSCMHRQHASVATSTSTSLNEAEPELNAETNPLFEIGPVELDQMRDETCPRISAADVINLGAHKLCMIDIRPQSEYQQMNIALSRNIPFENINFNKLESLTQVTTPNESDATSFLFYLLQTNHNLVKVVIANETLHHQAVELANYLVRKHRVAKVCLLHNGIESLRGTRLFQQFI